MAATGPAPASWSAALKDKEAHLHEMERSMHELSEQHATERASLVRAHEKDKRKLEDA